MPNECRELNLAILCWSADREVPFDVVCHLVGLGYDVEALEREYRTFPAEA